MTLNFLGLSILFGVIIGVLIGKNFTFKSKSETIKNLFFFSILLLVFFIIASGLFVFIVTSNAAFSEQWGYIMGSSIGQSIIAYISFIFGFYRAQSYKLYIKEQKEH